MTFFGRTIKHAGLQQDLLEDVVEREESRATVRLQWGYDIQQRTNLTFVEYKDDHTIKRCGEPWHPV